MTRQPKRIQRKRTKGWRMPDGAVYVGRPTVWGNPFWNIALDINVELSIALYRELAQGFWDPSLVSQLEDWRVHDISQSHQHWLRKLGRHPLEAMRTDLRGLDLACFCPLDAPCHADILLELANQ